MARATISVCVISDQPIVTAGTRTLLAEYAGSAHGFEFVADHRDADVVIYDVFKLATSGDGDRVAEIRALAAAHPGRVLALSRLLQPGLTARALAAGAVAPVSIGADADELVGLVEAVFDSGLVLDAELAEQHLAELARALRSDVGLTERQETVLGLIAAGYSNDEIADELFVSINTIKSIIRNAYSRIGVQTRSQAIAWAIEHGYGSHARRARRTVRTQAN